MHDMHRVDLNNKDPDPLVWRERSREWIKKKEDEQMTEWVSVVVEQPTMEKKEAHTSRIYYPWINDGTGAVVFPHWDMNQISTQSSLEVRAGISLTGHLVPEHGHQGVDVATLIVMSPSPSL